VVTIYLASVSILALGLRFTPGRYTDPAFVASFLPVEVVLATFFVVVTLTLFRPSELGLRWPEWRHPARLIPIALLAVCGLVAWGVGRAQASSGGRFGDSLSARTLASALFVGFTEEWMYRGLLLVALSRALGPRRGAIVALVMFGALHFLNLLAGVPPPLALAQFASTMIIGATLLVAALTMRSLLIPMLVHALHDFYAVEAGRGVASGASPVGPAILSVMAFATGIASLVLLRRMGPELDERPFARD